MGSDGGTLFLFEREGEGAARSYRKSKALGIEGQSIKIRNLAVSPTEDTLLCTLENNQMYSLNLTNTEVMKVCCTAAPWNRLTSSPTWAHCVIKLTSYVTSSSAMSHGRLVKKGLFRKQI